VDNLYEILVLVIGGGFFGFLGVVITLFFTRKKSQAETEKARAEVKRLEEETEKLSLENQKLNLEYQKIRQEQTNLVLKENSELIKAKEELKAKLYIANEEKFLLSKELSTYRIESIEKQKKIEEFSANQKKFEELLANQHKDIVEIKKNQTGELSSQMPAHEQK